MLRKALSILLTISFVVGSLTGIQFFQKPETALAAEIPAEMSPYEASDFVSLYDDPEGFISGSTLIFNNDANFQDRIKIDLRRMKNIYHVNTVGVYDLVHMSDADRIFFFDELRANDQKAVVRIENYDADTFHFDTTEDVDYVMDYYTSEDPANGYTSLLDFIKVHNYMDEIAYFAINMPVDDGNVADNFEGGRSNPAWATSQPAYADALIGRLRAFFAPTQVQLYISVFYGWDLTYPTPSYADIANKADGYFLNNYSYPINGSVPDENADPSVIINEAGLQAAMDKMMSQYPTEPKIIEYGFHTQEFSEGKPVSQTAGLVKDIDTKKIALKAETNFYKHGTAKSGTASGQPFNFRGSLYFAQNLYKEEGTPAVLMDWALDYPSTEAVEAEDPLSTVYQGGLTSTAGGVDLDAEGKGVTLFNFNESKVLRVKYTSAGDNTLSLYVNGVYIKKVTFENGTNADKYIDADIPLQGSVTLKRDAGDGEVFLDNVLAYSNYEAEVNTQITGADIVADTAASNSKAVSMTQAFDSVTYTGVKSGSEMVIGYDSDTDALLGLYVNDKLVQSLSFEASRDDSSLSFIQRTIPVFIPGNATVKLELISGALNLDYIQVKGQYEAEYASGKYNGAACAASSNASNHTVVKNITANGASAVFNGLIAGRQLKIRYSNASGSDRQLTLYVNGVSRTVTFPATADEDTFADNYINVEIPDGASVILQRNSNNTADGLSLDYISVMSWYEAEAVNRSGTSVIGDLDASNGNLAGLENTSDYVELAGAEAGSQLQIRYASALDAQLSLYINNRYIAKLVFPSTGAGTGSFGTITANISIPEGAAVKLALDADDSPVNLDTILIIEKTEAENANFSGGAATYSDSTASGGMGAEFSVEGNAAEYTNLKAGNRLAINYTCAVDGKLGLYVNGIYMKDVTFNSIGVWKGKINTRYVDADIPSNASVTFKYEAGGSRVRIDNFSVLGVSEAENSFAKTAGITQEEDINASNGLEMTGFAAGEAITFVNNNGAKSVTFRYKSDSDVQLSLFLKYRDVTDDHIDKFYTNDTPGYYKTDDLGTLRFPATNGEYRTAAVNVNMLDFMQLILKADTDDTVDGSFKLDSASFTDKYEAEAAVSAGESITFNNVAAANRLIIGYTAQDAGKYSLYVAEPGKDFAYRQDVTFKASGSLSGPIEERIVDIDIPYGSSIRLQNDSGDAAVNFGYVKPEGIYEAEDGNFTNHARAWYHADSNASGNYYVWGFADVNDSAELTDVRSGNQVIAGYAEGPDNPGAYGQLGLLVNETYTGDIVFAHTGSWGNWRTVTTDRNIAADSNLKLENIDQSGKTVNFDYIEVRDKQREAENANLYGNAGTYTDASASYGTAVNGLNTLNDAVEFGDMNEGGQLKIRYAAQTDGKLNLYVNGMKKQEITFPATGGWTGSYGDVTVNTDIRKGSIVKLQYESGSAPVNIDCIEVSGAYPSNNRYEAENADLTGDLNITEDAQASGGWKVNNFTAGGALEIPAVNTGNALLVRYACTSDSRLSLYVNGRKQQEVDFTATAGAMATKEIKVHIPQGVKAALKNDGASAVSLNIDYIQVSDKYEAEYAILSGLSNDNPPIPLQAVDVPGASNGKATACFWAPDNGSGSLEFTGVGAGTQLTIAYASGDTNPRHLSLYINGEDKGDITFAPYPGGDWNGHYNLVKVPVEIPEGASVKIQKDPGDSEVNFDYIKVEGSYEAENANKIGCAYNVDDYTGETAHASGGIQVSGINTYGSGVEFTDVIAGNKLDLTYASQDGGEIYVYVNGGAQQKVVLPSTGSYTSYAAQSIFVNINAGDSVRILCANPVKPVTLDKIKVYTSDEQAPTSRQVTSDMDGVALIVEYGSTIDGNMTLYVNNVQQMVIPVTDTHGASVSKELKLPVSDGDAVRLDFEEGMSVASMKVSDKYEAEYSNLYGIDGSNPTTVLTDAGASNGQAVVHIWGPGSYLEFENVCGGEKLTMGYSAADAGGRKISVYINDVDTGIDLVISSTGGWGGAGNYAELTVPCTIPAGATVKLKKDGDDWSDFFIDYIKVWTPAFEDVTPPSAPAAVNLVSKTNRMVSLSWEAAADDVGVTGYDVYTNGEKANASNITGTGYTVRGLTPDEDYTFTVKAKDAQGHESDPASLSLRTDAAETSSDVIYEAEYSKLYGVENIHVEPDSGASNNEKVVCIWGAGAYLEFPKVVSGSALTVRYASGDPGRKISVYINGADSGKDVLFDATGGYGGIGNYREATVNVDIPAGATVKLQRDGDDNTDVHIDYIEIYTPGTEDTTPPAAPADHTAPTVPAGLTLVGKTATAVVFTWTASTDDSGAVSYDVYRNNVRIATVDTPSCSDTGLSPATAYVYKIAAKDTAGNESEQSAAFYVTTNSAVTPTPVPTATPSPSPSPVPTTTPIPTVSSAPTSTPVPTVSPSPTVTPTPAVTAVPTAIPTPVPTITPTTIPTATPTPTTTPTPKPASTPTPKPTATPTPLPAPVKGSLSITPEVEGTTAQVSVDLKSVTKAFTQVKADKNGDKTIQIAISPAKGIEEYSVEFPKEVFTDNNASADRIKISTQVGTVTVPVNMFTDSDLKGSDKVAITIKAADLTKVNADVKALTKNKPVIEINASVDGKTVSWKNNETPVTISLDYKPTAQERKHPEAIVIYYIDGKGQLQLVPNGNYDASTGKVTFETTHFSIYCVGYHYVTFQDLDKYKSAKSQIEAMASKGIMSGVTKTEFKPGDYISRGEFIDILVKTLSLSADFKTNFSDVKKSGKWYQSVGIAKALGIIKSADNKFNPDAKITRQEMAAFTVSAMLSIDEIKLSKSTSVLNKYTDSSKIDKAARTGMATLINEGILVISGKTINPTGKVTRADAAVIAYQIYNRLN